MTIDPIASRYAEALFASAKAEQQLDQTLESLAEIGGLIRAHHALRELLLNPDVDPPDKYGVLQRTLKASWSPLVSGFLTMLVTRHRAEHLPEIADAFHALVDAERGQLRALVRSAHPLDAPALARLRTRLEAREGKRVDLTTEVDAKLLGGFQVLLGHRIIDGSVASQLAALRVRLTSIKVT